MENLNAEKVKKALEIHTGILNMLCEECPYNCDAHDEICLDFLTKDALALINSQEQRIKELTEENERLRADTIDEFVKMVKEKMREVATGKRASLVGIGWLDQIAKELKGEG